MNDLRGALAAEKARTEQADAMIQALETLVKRLEVRLEEGQDTRRYLRELAEAEIELAQSAGLALEALTESAWRRMLAILDATER